jgi:type III secretory pathway component EscS
MTRTRPFLIEAAAQIVLAAAVGLFVSIVLAGTTLLLAA